MKRLAIISCTLLCSLSARAEVTVPQPPIGLIQMMAGTSDTLRFPRGIRRVVIGDSNLVDATPVPESDRTLTLQAKFPGYTNLIVLDENGAEIYRAEVSITTRVPAPGAMGEV